MSSWNCSTSEERIARWKEFRDTINGEDEEVLLNNVAQFFADVPVGSRSMDFYTPDSWPTPWEILYHKLFCANSISLMIYYTLTLVLDEDRVELILIDDDTDRFIVPILDKKYILNYVLGEISNIDDFPQIAIIEKFAKEEIRSFK